MKKLLLGLVLLVGTHSAFADQAVINFGIQSVNTGAQQTQYVTLTNTDATSMGPLEIISECFAPDFNVQSDCPSILPSNTACNIYISFKPSRAGSFQCEIRIGSENAPGESDVIVEGEGTE